MADNTEIINCPACGKRMQKVFMPTAGVNLDVCTDGCGGIYFDNREFKKFDEEHEDIKPLETVLSDKKFESVDTSLTRICPVCGMKMVKTHASARHAVEIDTCYGCGGIFLDNGELQEIRAEYPNEAARAEDAVKELYNFVGAEIKETKDKHDEISKKFRPCNSFVNFGTKIIKEII